MMKDMITAGGCVGAAYVCACVLLKVFGVC